MLFKYYSPLQGPRPSWENGLFGAKEKKVHDEPGNFCVCVPKINEVLQKLHHYDERLNYWSEIISASK